MCPCQADGRPLLGQACGVNDRPTPVLQGIHHVRVPVSDVGASREWYRDVLGFEAVLDFEEEVGLMGTVLSHRSGLATLGLHLDAERAAAMRGFCLLALQVEGQSALYDWVEYLDDLDIGHFGVRDGHLGLLVEVPDPDGLLVQLHTGEHPSGDEA
jgi:catechol 2,3-dioxygenase-like lactoylglutathione lyase family enzyme